MKPTPAIDGKPCKCPLKLWNAMRSLFAKALKKNYMPYLKDQYSAVRCGDTSIALADISCQFITYK
jgi:hypothetical protein